MSTIKYIAAGFLKDSENLLKEFVQENSTNFKDFTAKWIEHNFSLIFSGRDKDELEQFTNEIFQLTLGYLENGSIILQVGAVYLLYALYLNQKSNPLVKIRITLTQWEILRKLENLSEVKGYIHLYYIINFLFTNSLHLVANGVRLGPCCSKGKIEVEKAPFHASFMLKDCKTEMTNFHNSNLLEEIKNLSKEYARLGQKFLPLNDRALDGSDMEEYADCLGSLITDGTSKTKVTKNAVDVDLGNRRAKIKANQFSRKALFRQLNPSDSDEDYEPVEVEKEKQVKRFPKKKRVAKEKRKVGRPKKFDFEKLLETDESDQGPKVKVSRRRGPIQRGSYLEKYELKIPQFNKKMFKDFMEDCSSESSEEESAAGKEASDIQDIIPNAVEEEYCNEDQEDPDILDIIPNTIEEKYCKEDLDIQDITPNTLEEEDSNEDLEESSNEEPEIYTLL